MSGFVEQMMGHGVSHLNTCSPSYRITLHCIASRDSFHFERFITMTFIFTVVYYYRTHYNRCFRFANGILEMGFNASTTIMFFRLDGQIDYYVRWLSEICKVNEIRLQWNNVLAFLRKRDRNKNWKIIWWPSALQSSESG